MQEVIRPTVWKGNIVQSESKYGALARHTDYVRDYIKGNDSTNYYKKDHIEEIVDIKPKICDSWEHIPFVIPLEPSKLQSKTSEVEEPVSKLANDLLTMNLSVNNKMLIATDTVIVKNKYNVIAVNWGREMIERESIMNDDDIEMLELITEVLYRRETVFYCFTVSTHSELDGRNIMQLMPYRQVLSGDCGYYP